MTQGPISACLILTQGGNIRGSDIGPWANIRGSVIDPGVNIRGLILTQGSISAGRILDTGSITAGQILTPGAITVRFGLFARRAAGLGFRVYKYIPLKECGNNRSPGAITVVLLFFIGHLPNRCRPAWYSVFVPDQLYIHGSARNPNRNPVGFFVYGSRSGAGGGRGGWGRTPPASGF